MNNRIASLNWSLVQAFLAVAEEGSLSAAARKLGQSQPTLGRQIKQIEAALEAELFIRQPRGLSLTTTGRQMVVPARRMREAMNSIALTAAGTSARAEGTVRLTASHVVAQFFLPDILAKLRETHPAIHITLIPSDVQENLLFREADIAVRMLQSSQLDIVTRKLGALDLGIYAAPGYLARKGRPHSIEDFIDHDIVGYDKSGLILQGMRALGLPAEKITFATKCDDQVTYLELVRQGCGIGFCQTAIAQASGLEEILPDFPIPPLPVWLATPEALRRVPRISVVWEALKTGLAPYVS
jgi:DNA-binding transcriptional LysR family regulator